MARTAHDVERHQASGLDQLRDELVDYMGAQVENLADKAGDKLGDLTDQLTQVSENGGILPKVGLRVLQGDSPVKALVGEKAKSIKSSLTEKAKNLFGGKGKGRKSGTTKVMNIVEHLDVGVPVRFAYDHWTQFEKFSGFTKGVRSASRVDDTTSDWKVKVGPSTRSWKASVQEQIPDERIVWTSEGAKGTTRGCVSFHEVTPTLTHIVLVVEYYPSGLFEKTGNIWRAQGRRLRLDAKHFQRYVSLTSEEPEGWRGEIRDGEVVRTHEEALEEEEAEYEAEEGEETPPEGEEDEYADDEYDDDAYEQDEEEPEGEEEREDGEEPDGEAELEDDEEWEDEEEPQGRAAEED
ncbi:SRPBCC family protein [Streptomyces adustus]|uniref:SRPBCC family protein n=1 Tax=Streptomyces adustus TaxID=1609272 RepID=UPI0037244B45